MRRLAKLPKGRAPEGRGRSVGLDRSHPRRSGAEVRRLSEPKPIRQACHMSEEPLEPGSLPFVRRVRTSPLMNNVSPDPKRDDFGRAQGGAQSYRVISARSKIYRSRSRVRPISSLSPTTRPKTSSSRSCPRRARRLRLSDGRAWRGDRRRQDASLDRRPPGRHDQLSALAIRRSQCRSDSSAKVSLLPA